MVSIEQGFSILPLLTFQAEQFSALEDQNVQDHPGLHPPDASIILLTKTSERVSRGKNAKCLWGKNNPSMKTSAV